MNQQQVREEIEAQRIIRSTGGRTTSKPAPRG